MVSRSAIIAHWSHTTKLVWRGFPHMELGLEQEAVHHLEKDGVRVSFVTFRGDTRMRVSAQNFRAEDEPKLGLYAREDARALYNRLVIDGFTVPDKELA